MENTPMVKSRHIMLRIPVISWIFTVFPLILPPLPLGAVSISFAWNRVELVPLVKRVREYLNCPVEKHEFPWGWAVNFCLNVMDIATLGLRSAFFAARFADKMETAATKSPVRLHNNLKWLFKWLLRANVVFLVAWIVFPGWVLLRFIESTEQILSGQNQTEPVNTEINANTSALGQ